MMTENVAEVSGAFVFCLPRPRSSQSESGYPAQVYSKAAELTNKTSAANMDYATSVYIDGRLTMPLHCVRRLQPCPAEPDQERIDHSTSNCRQQSRARAGHRVEKRGVRGKDQNQVHA